MSAKNMAGEIAHQSSTAGALAPDTNAFPDAIPRNSGLEATVPPPPAHQDNPQPANNVHTHLNNSVNVNVAMPSIQMNTMAKGHSLATRVIWYFFVGWWLSAIFIALGVFFTWTVILMPLGFWFINRIPKAQTLRERTRQFTTEFKDNSIVFTEGNRVQHPWYLRAPYALTVGAVAGIVWLTAAWILGLLIVTLPLSIWMIDRAPRIMTLQKN